MTVLSKLSKINMSKSWGVRLENIQPLILSHVTMMSFIRG